MFDHWILKLKRVTNCIIIRFCFEITYIAYCYRTKSCQNSSLCSAIKNINHFLTASFVDRMHFIHLISYCIVQTLRLNLSIRNVDQYSCSIHRFFYRICWNRVLKLWYIVWLIVSVRLKLYSTVKSRFKKDLNLQFWPPVIINSLLVPKYFVKQILFYLRNEKRGFLNSDLPV